MTHHDEMVAVVAWLWCLDPDHLTPEQREQIEERLREWGE
jgi:hypothetical protein